MTDLSLYGTKVTKQGVDKLQESVPGLIYWEPENAAGKNR